MDWKKIQPSLVPETSMHKKEGCLADVISMNVESHDFTPLPGGSRSRFKERAN